MYNENIQYLLDLTSIHEVNTTQTIFLPELVQIGYYMGGEPVYVNYIDGCFYEDRLTAHVMYDRKHDDLYGSNYDFTWLNIVNCEHHSDKMDDIILFDDWLTRIVDSIKSDESFLAQQLYYREVRMPLFCRLQRDGSEPLNWEESLIYHEASAFIDKYLYHRSEKSMHQNTLDRMIELGETEYNRVTKEETERMMNILKDL